MKRLETRLVPSMVALLCVPWLVLACGKQKTEVSYTFDTAASADQVASQLAKIQAANLTPATELLRLEECGRRYDPNKTSQEFLRKAAEEYNRVFVKEAATRMVGVVRDSLKKRDGLSTSELTSRPSRVAAEMMQELARKAAKNVPDWLKQYGCTQRTKTDAQRLVESQFRLPDPAIVMSSQGTLWFQWQR